MVMNTNPYKWFINGYCLVGQNVRPCTPLPTTSSPLRLFYSCVGSSPPNTLYHITVSVFQLPESWDKKATTTTKPYPIKWGAKHQRDVRIFIPSRNNPKTSKHPEKSKHSPPTKRTTKLWTWHISTKS